FIQYTNDLTAYCIHFSGSDRCNTLSLHDALPILKKYFRAPIQFQWGLPIQCCMGRRGLAPRCRDACIFRAPHINRSRPMTHASRSEEHTSELQSRGHLVCRLLLEKKKELALL